jgi:U6 snRNA-associated Sm-like protein LSm2
MLFYSFFKTLVGSPVEVELKNDLKIVGTLVSVDQFLNFKLENIKSQPQFTSLKSMFIRGSVVRFVKLHANLVDTTLLQDAARKESI